MILIWGVPQDGPIRAVHQALQAAGEASLMLDQFEVTHCGISLEPTDLARATLTVHGQVTKLASISAVYLRPYETNRVLRAASALDVASQEHAFRFDDDLLLWIELTAALVVNRPSAMASNNSKPLQAALIARSGFHVPATLLTSDREAASEFLGRYGRVVYKSTGGVRSRVSMLDDAVIERLRDGACPLQLQEYIDGTDYRVHVLGDDIFACKIQSGAVDYRYPLAPEETPTITPALLPADVANRCVALARHLGLLVAGIDLRQCADGRWICFEANPSPGYTYYENLTQAPITAALVSLLRKCS